MTYGPVLQRLATQAAHNAPPPGVLAAGAGHPIHTAVNNALATAAPTLQQATTQAATKPPGRLKQFAQHLGGVSEAGLLGIGALGWAGLSAAQDASAVSDVYETRTGRSGTVPGVESGLGSFVKRLLGIGIGGGLGYGLGQVAAGGLKLNGKLGALVRLPLAIGGAIVGHSFINHHSPSKGMRIREQMDYYGHRYNRHGQGSPTGYDTGYNTGHTSGANRDTYRDTYKDPYGQVTQQPIGIVGPYGGPRKGFIDSNHDGFNDIHDPRYRDTRAPMALRDMAEIRGDYKGYWHYPQDKHGNSQGLPTYTMPHPGLDNHQGDGHSHGTTYKDKYLNGSHSSSNPYGSGGWANQDILRLKPGGELLEMYRKSPRALDNYFKDFQQHYTDNIIHGTRSYADVLGVGPPQSGLSPPRDNMYAGTAYLPPDRP